MTGQERAEASERIRRRLAELPEWQAAGTVLLFLSMPDEVDTLPARPSPCRRSTPAAR